MASTFTLMLQTGAFLQFILVLTALVSRLDVLVSELQTVLQNLDATVTNFVEALVSSCAMIDLPV